jgi:hypothetical protein
VKYVQTNCLFWADLLKAAVKLSAELALGKGLVDFSQNVRRAENWFICSPETVDKRCGEVCHAGGSSSAILAVAPRGRARRPQSGLGASVTARPRAAR